MINLKKSDLRKIKYSPIKDGPAVIREGYFHKWVTYAKDGNYEEYALVEDIDGTMHETYPVFIAFIN